MTVGSPLLKNSTPQKDVRKGNAVTRLWIHQGAAQWRLCASQKQKLFADNIEALHDLRVALRRLRVWLLLTAELTEEARFRSLEEQCRRLQKALGPLRDLDITMLNLRQLAASPEDSRVPLSITSIETRLREHWEREREKAQRALDRYWPIVAKEIARALRSVAHFPIRRKDIRRVAGEMIEEWKKKIRRRWKKADPEDVDAMHRLRIAVRRLRYIYEFLVPLYEKQAAKRAEMCKKVQDILGDIHDLDVIRTCLRTRKIEETPRVTRLLMDKRRRLARNLERHWDDFEDKVLSSDEI